MVITILLTVRLVESFEVISSVYAQQLPRNTTQNVSFQSITLIAQRVSHSIAHFNILALKKSCRIPIVCMRVCVCVHE